ncbi:MerR family transcriptional regulator [Acrocarpospora catenulata]|uniref:MerR family transcriptional regulator n=1 Tax=Acrocarpospora catenulata TaxID=2836182 RepID=UPI001BDAF417|nr:MerR family transcriptional regulator [Acrocarpospora catenulata]
MRIGELASRAGVSVRSLRYYEEQGLLTSTRSPSGQRHYTDNELERVAFIQRLYAAGLSSRMIVELLPCVESPSEQNSDEAFERLLQERDRISRHIEDLSQARDALDRLIDVNRTHRDQLTSARRRSRDQPEWTGSGRGVPANLLS